MDDIETNTVQYEWTGEKIRKEQVSPLYQAYRNRAIISLDGTEIGTVLHLWDDTYQPRVPGLMAGNQASFPDAVGEVLRIHRRYRA